VPNDEQELPEPVRSRVFRELDAVPLIAPEPAHARYRFHRGARAGRTRRFVTAGAVAAAAVVVLAAGAFASGNPRWLRPDLEWLPFAAPTATPAAEPTPTPAPTATPTPAPAPITIPPPATEQPERESAETGGATPEPGGERESSTPQPTRSPSAEPEVESSPQPSPTPSGTSGDGGHD
jgi:outer membrane biosynthesis protein TonB